ncbi:MAG: hypothetical protein CMQ17_11055 [Gammaproteobacteria bacterium]|jgi:hypothetical protein|nr:hypothetical protein [Gammaproteobacteria bacterium]
MGGKSPALPASDSVEAIDPLVFQDEGFVKMATGAPVWVSATALIHRERWKEDEFGAPIFIKKFNRPKGSYVAIYVVGEHILAGQAAWDVVSKFDIGVVSLHLLFAAYAMQAQNGCFGPASSSIKGTNLIKMLGMDRRIRNPSVGNDGKQFLTKSMKLLHLVELVQSLSRLSVRVFWKDSQKNCNVSLSPLWEVCIDYLGGNSFDQSLKNPEEVIIRVRAGLWAEKFLNPEAAEDKTASTLFQYGLLAASTLRINPYQEGLAAQLAVELTFRSRINRGKSRCKVDTLWKEVLPDTDSGKRNRFQSRKQRYRMKQRWDSALTTLKNLGWRIEFDDSTYPLEYRPPWAKGENSGRPLPKGYFAKLRQAVLSIWSPEYAEIGRESESAVELRPEIIRRYRQDRRMTQRDLAGALGKHQTWVSMLETGKAKVTGDEMRNAMIETLGIGPQRKTGTGGL